VLAVGAIARIGPASGPDRRTVDRSFAVLAAPIVAQSNASGAVLNTILTNGPSLERTRLFSDLASITAASSDDDRHFAALSPPMPSGDAARRCGSTMDDRQRASALVRMALEHLLGGPGGTAGGNEAAAAQTLTGAGAMLESADASWAACRRTLRRAPGSALLPPSTWVRDPGVWGASALGQLVAAMAGSPSLAPVHRLAFLVVSTDPASVPGASGVSVVPPTTALLLRIVLADQGNVDEQGVRLVVVAVPRGTAPAPATVRVRADIGAGESVAVSPPPLSVRLGTSYVLDITATPQDVGASVSASVSLRVASFPPPSTTTTTSSTPKNTATTLHFG